MLAKSQKIVRVCDRCNKDAVTSRDLVVDGERRRLDLCDIHNARFDNDLIKWTSIGTPETSTSVSFFNDQQRLLLLREREAERTRIASDAEDAEKHAEKAARKSIPGALKWDVLPHARQRAVKRGFGIVQVLMTAAQPEHTRRQPWRGPDIAIFQRGECRLVVNDRDRKVITVIDRSEEEEDHAAVIASG